jgi:multisubunit Na+/H+ antiporter MnhF subunit
MIVYLYFLCLLLIPSTYRLFVGPTSQDRLLGLSLVSVEATLILCIYAVLLGQSLYLDIAIILALLSFAQITAFLKLHKAGRKA